VDNLTFGIAGWDLIGPITLQGLLVEGESFWTVEDITTAVGTVQELPAIVFISKSEVTKLMRTLTSGLSGF
jgi:hypothetical protein